MIIGVKERGIPAAVAAERHVVQTDAKAIDSGSPRRCRIIRRMSLGRSDQLGLGLCPAKVKKTKLYITNSSYFILAVAIACEFSHMNQEINWKQMGHNMNKYLLSI